MRDNPMSNDPASGKPTDVLQRRDRMEDLPLKSSPPPSTTASEVAPDDSAELRQEETLTFRYAIVKLNEFLQWFITVLEVTLLIRFVLRLIGADPANLFAGFLYALTQIILIPFTNIVYSPSVHVNQAFEWSTLLGMAIYWLIFWAIRRFLRILITGPEEAAS